MRSSACAPTSSARAAARDVEIDADLPLAQHAEWGTDSSTYSTGVPPSIAAQMLARGGQPRAPASAAPRRTCRRTSSSRELAARGMHAEVTVRRPLA